MKFVDRYEISVYVLFFLYDELVLRNSVNFDLIYM